jgi:hypothetical protein
MSKLTLDAKISVIAQAVDDYQFYQESGMGCPSDQTFKVVSRNEDLTVLRAARVAAMKNFQGESPLKKVAFSRAEGGGLVPIVEAKDNKQRDLFAEMLEAEQARPNNQAAVQPLSGQRKVAFDTRRVDQEAGRIPRSNLQYWHRTDPFVEEKDEKKLQSFARLMKVMDELRQDFGSEPEWFESYARVLYDAVHRILRIKQADLEIFRPQVSYLEQLVYARYRLTMSDLATMPEEHLRRVVLSKDEVLMKRGDYLRRTGIVKSDGEKKDDPKLVVDGNGGKSTQEALINAIFGNDNLRRDGERSVERVITITVRDNVID